MLTLHDMVMEVVRLNEFSYNVFKNPQLFLMCIVYMRHLTIIKL